MDNLKQLGKILRKNNDVANHNIRRAKENFPLIARTNDKVSPAQSFKHEFLITDHPHRVSASIFFREPEPPCEVVPIEQLGSFQLNCPTFGAQVADGVEYPENGGSVVTNVGGFTSAGIGWAVPFTGIYEIHMQNSVGGVSLGGGALITASIRVNGAVVSQMAYPQHCDGACLLDNGTVNIWATVEIAAGGVVSTWMSAKDIAFWTPSNICFGSGSYNTINLVAEA